MNSPSNHNQANLSILESIDLYQVRSPAELKELMGWIKEMPFELTIPNYLCSFHDKNDPNHPIRNIKATYLASWEEGIDFSLEFDLFEERLVSTIYAPQRRMRRLDLNSPEHKRKQGLIDQLVLREMIRPLSGLTGPVKNYLDNGISSSFNYDSKEINVFFAMANNKTFPDTQ